jgi:dTDP-4-amino-4,6-dideoxygalactose transaminase
MSLDVQNLARMATALAEDPDALACLAGGQEVGELERTFAAAAGCAFAVACGSGTAAIQTALLAHDIGPGDEVIVPAYGWSQTVTAVLACGATPVFADVSGRSGTLAAIAAERMVSPRTRALLATHLFGNPADMAGLRRLARDKGLVLIADACHALGASIGGVAVGGLADASAYSLGRGKIVGAGEGGVVTTSSRVLYERMLLLSQHPLRARAELTEPSLSAELGSWSLTSRVTRLTAAVGLVQIGTLTSRLERRQLAREQIRAEIARGPAPAALLEPEPTGTSAAHEHIAVARSTEERALLRSYFERRGLAVSAGPVRTPLHLRAQSERHWWPRLLDPRRAVGHGEVGRCPIAESLCQRELWFS